MSKYVFDSYAIIEIVKGNPNYAQYKHDEVVINNFIYAELWYNLLKGGKGNLKEVIGEYSEHISSVKPEWIEEAMRFRLAWKDRGVSMADCISYIMAKNLGIKFLTGGKEFEGVEGVEFVK